MAKRQKESLSVKDLMGSFIQENNLAKGIQKISIKENWDSLMGNGVTSYTEKVELRKGTLFVKLSSSVLREELSYGKDKIKDMMNDAIGGEEIKKVILV
jgi:hypothetical protein